MPRSLDSDHCAAPDRGEHTPPRGSCTADPAGAIQLRDVGDDGQSGVVTRYGHRYLLLPYHHEYVGVRRADTGFVGFGRTLDDAIDDCIDCARDCMRAVGWWHSASDFHPSRVVIGTRGGWITTAVNTVPRKAD